MTKKFTYFCLFLVVLAFASCKKDNSTSNNPNGNLLGDWSLVSMHLKTLATTQYAAGGSTLKTVTASDYTTENNIGYITITADSIKGIGIGYSATINARGANFVNGVFTDSIGQSIPVVVPATNSGSKYQSIGSDSLYMTAGGLLSVPGSAAQPTQGQGYKYTISGSTLTMTTQINQNSSSSQGGILVTLNEQATAVVTLQKK
ncbi:hypothetical protein ACX0G9_29245 [Flavitalea flava]